MNSDNVIVMRPDEPVSFEAPRQEDLRSPLGVGPAGLWADDAVEEMVICLAALEAAWAAGEFARLRNSAASVAMLADRCGLDVLARIACEVHELTARKDDVALAAVVARLVRMGENSLATILEIGYRQV